MAGEPVLVVDDNPANLKLATFATFRPRLILRDTQMPGMGGFEPTRFLKPIDTPTPPGVVAGSIASKESERR